METYCALIIFWLSLASVDAQTAEKLLNKVADDYWQWKLETFPESATSYGYHDHDDKLTQYTEDAFAARKEKCEDFMRDLEIVSADELPNQVTKDTLAVTKEEIQEYIKGYKWRDFGNLNTVNFLEGAQRPPGWISTMRFRNLEDYQMYLMRMKLYRTQLQQMVQLMRKAMEFKRTNHMVSVAAVPEQIEEQQNKTGVDSVFYAPFNNETLTKSSVALDLWEELRNNATKIIDDEINAAWGEMKTFLLDEYMKNTRSTYGVSGWDGGLEFYKACLKYHLGSDMTPEMIRDTGLQEIERIKGNMQEIMKENGFEGTIPEFFENLRTDPTERAKYYNKTAEWLMSQYRYLVNERINNDTMLKVFHTVAPVACKVEERAYDGPAGSYSSSSNTFWVNTFNAKDRPTYTMAALAAHEANPGHHYQLSTANLLEVPKFRQKSITGGYYYSIPFTFLRYTAYTEGWGLYAEFLGEEMDVYNKTALELMGRYSSEIFRACRLVVDTGLHAFNMSRQEAIWLIGNNTAIPLSQIETEVDRYITWPGQACAYKIGELEIKKWRDEARSELGEDFDVRDFHKAVVDTGRAPLAIAEQAVKNYIQKKLDERTTVSPTAPPIDDVASAPPGTFTCLVVYIIMCFMC